MELLPGKERQSVAREQTQEISIEEELKTAYLGYAMSVIVGRALPDVRDGLKPVQRRILYAMHGLGNTAQKAHKKSGRIVGDVLGKYHPHGDAPIYDAIVRMAQEFSLRHPLIDGQGNFGSVDGDPAAHFRYTEVRLTPIAQTLLSELDKETVSFSPNYDGSEVMPDLLPAGFPNLLVNGCTGIAVGMATNIPPHNLGETLEACLAYLERPEIRIEELLEYLPGPDFPTGGIIHGTTGILEAYRTGRGRVVLRARAEVQEVTDREQIIIHELPYQVNKSRLLESIAELVKEKKLEGISEIRDESDRDGMRVVIEIKRGGCAEIVLNHLYQQTALESAFSVNMLVLREGRPIRANLKEILEAFIIHRRTVVTRRTFFEAEKARARLHILDGLMVALAHLDQCIALIREAASPMEAKTTLMQTAWLPSPHASEIPEHLSHSDYRLSQDQAQAILDLRLHRLTSLENEKLSREYWEVTTELQKLEFILSDLEALTRVIQSELIQLKSHSDPRRTQIQGACSVSDEDFIPHEDVVVTFSLRGYIKYQPLAEYGAQRRGGRGKSATAICTEDVGEACLVAGTHDQLLCFSSRGRVYWLKVYQLPRAGRGARGRPIVNLLPLVDEERITTILPLSKGEQPKFVFLATSAGTVKKLPLSELQTSRSGGLIAARLQDGDRLVSADFTDGEQEILLFSSQGKVVRFSESQVRPMGRGAGGMKGIQLDPGDQVVALIVPKAGGEILTVTECGFGKRSVLSSYPSKSRATKGVISIKVNERNGKVMGALQVFSTDQMILLTHQGILLRLRVEEVTCIGRNTHGVKILRLDEGDHVVSLQRLLDPPPTLPHETDLEESPL